MFKLLDEQYEHSENDDLAVLLSGMNPIPDDDQVSFDAAMMFDWLSVLGGVDAATEITDQQWRHAVLNFLREKEKSMGITLITIISSITP